MRTVAFLLALALLFVTGIAKAVTFTGCLTNAGAITKVAIGTEPKNPCTGNSDQISWNSDGPQGPSGQDGQDGIDGEQGPPGAGVQQFEYVGLSMNFVAANAGVIAMSRDCDATFPGSRMCTSEEILKTVDPPIGPANGLGWVQPTIVGVRNNLLVDASGATEASIVPSMSCLGWGTSASGNAGLSLQFNSGVITTIGRFSTRQCNATDANVTCCAPVE